MYTLCFDVFVPAGLLYLYVANVLQINDFDIKKLKQFNGHGSEDSGQQIGFMIIASLLPLSFFLFSRRFIGNIVWEKEKGHLQNLQMNGMNATAYNVSFMLHEALIIAPLICLTLNAVIWYFLFH